MAISKEIQTTTQIDADGNESTTVLEKTTNIQRNNEPDFIKLYTKMWCEYNGIPTAYRNLFLELVTRMTYCNTADLGSSQLVNTGKPWSESIMAALGWQKAMYQRGLRELCACGAIRKVGKGVYQVNPQYAGRGEWKYNPRLNRGGVEDLVATFSFKDGTVDTKITWADDGQDSDINKTYRQGLGVSRKNQAVLKQTQTKKTPKAKTHSEEVVQLPGQLSLEDLPEIAEPLPFV